MTNIMQFPVGKIVGKQIDELFQTAIKYNLSAYYDALDKFQPNYFYDNWQRLVRSIDELINLPLEIEDDKFFNDFISLDFDFSKASNGMQFQHVCSLLKSKFNENVSSRFQHLVMMSFAIGKAFEMQGQDLGLSSIANGIAYYQSRRSYFVATLNLIPKISKGAKVITYIDTLNELLPMLENCLVQVTTAYYNLLINQCLPDFEMISDGKIAKGNFHYEHLEELFLNPQRLSLIDQLELRSEMVKPVDLLGKSDEKIFSFSEVRNTLSLFRAAYGRYEVSASVEFNEIELLLDKISSFVRHDFHIIVDEKSYKEIASGFKKIVLYNDSTDYFNILNSYAPFQKVDKNYYSTVVLFTRFVHNTLSAVLLKNKTFQIHSGFVFEEKASKILEEKGYKPTGFKRISQKEFDLITVKDGKVYNFQCKNNLINISSVGLDYKKMGRLNNRLCRYYENALIKEEGRENLILSQTGLTDVSHFVISRYPVITRNNRIINFNKLEDWTL